MPGIARYCVHNKICSTLKHCASMSMRFHDIDILYTLDSEPLPNTFVVCPYRQRHMRVITGDLGPSPPHGL